MFSKNIFYEFQKIYYINILIQKSFLKEVKQPKLMEYTEFFFGVQEDTFLKIDK